MKFNVINDTFFQLFDFCVCFVGHYHRKARCNIWKRPLSSRVKVNPQNNQKLMDEEKCLLRKAVFVKYETVSNDLALIEGDVWNKKRKGAKTKQNKKINKAK